MRIDTRGISLEAEVFGTQGRPLVLIMGIGAQLVHWPVGLCEALVDVGFQVLRFDNRDAGLSTWLDGVKAPDLREGVLRRVAGLSVEAPYTLADMAADTVGILDHMGWSRAHIVGASMGGMIAQELAIRHRERVASLTSIMSTTGARRHSLARPHALKALMAPASKTADEAEERSVTLMATIGGSMARDEAQLRAMARTAFERGSNPAGFLRQFSAILASGDRTLGLQGLRGLPSVAIHGLEDPLIPPSGGRATAEALGCPFVSIEGMGHDLPPASWPPIVEAIAGLA
jgi:pimeloyl-ACP methyl ester carboxylesterase